MINTRHKEKLLNNWFILCQIQLRQEMKANILLQSASSTFSWGKRTSLREAGHQAVFTKLLWSPQSACAEFCKRFSESLSPAEAEDNQDVRRGTGWWRWQMAEANRASSITPCGYTLWLPAPQETQRSFHLSQTLMFGGIDNDFRSLSCSYRNLTQGAGRFSEFSCFTMRKLDGYLNSSALQTFSCTPLCHG